MCGCRQHRGSGQISFVLLLHAALQGPGNSLTLPRSQSQPMNVCTQPNQPVQDGIRLLIEELCIGKCFLPPPRTSLATLAEWRGQLFGANNCHSEMRCMDVCMVCLQIMRCICTLESHDASWTADCISMHCHCMHHLCLCHGTAITSCWSSRVPDPNGSHTVALKIQKCTEWRIMSHLWRLSHIIQLSAAG